jgi:hypothetical protein
MAASRRAAASSSSASQPTEPIETSQPDVPEVAEAKTSINPKVEGLVAEVKELGHFPDWTAPAENSFYQRLLRKRKFFSEKQWENLKNIGASQPAEVEQLVAEVRDLGPLRKKADPAYGALLIQELKSLGYYPRVQREVVCDDELAELMQTYKMTKPIAHKLMEEVLYFGRLPHQIKGPTTAPERHENQLAKKINNYRQQIPNDLWENVKDHCAEVVTVNGRDEAELGFACERSLKEHPNRIISLSINDSSEALPLQKFNKQICAPTAAKLILLARACPHLAQFRVEGAVFAEGVLSDALQAIARACRYLKKLELGRNNISDGAVEVVSQACPLLRLLDLSDSGISDVAMKAVARGCAQLVVLNVMHCVHLTDASFLALAQGCPRLRTLTVWDSSYATEKEVVLQRPRVTDLAISAIAQHCPHIERLELCGLEALTDAALHAVALGCRSLTHLDASLCCQLTDAAIQALVHHCANLSTLKLRHCARITTSGVSALAQVSLALKYLDARPVQLPIEVLRDCEVVGRGV